MTSRQPAEWRGLLVSVRDAAEARAAFAGGAAIIDVKEPTRGPLGAADPATLVDVAAAVDGRVPWTIACGELVELDRVDLAAWALPSHAGGLAAAAKAGPAGLALPAWQRRFAAFVAALPPGCEPVAVAYADAASASAPDPAAIIAAAPGMGCRIVLVDTFDKRGPGLLAADGGRERAAAWVAAAHASGLRVAVAGRVSIADIPAAVAIGADVVAVRSTVCGGCRLGRVRRTLVRAATLALASPPRAIERAATMSEARA